jgi:hypothetical protein
MMVTMETSLEKTEAMDLEENPEEIKSESEHHEISKEEAALKTVRALKERYVDQHLAVGRRRHLKKRTQGSGESQKQLAAARRGMTRHAIPAVRKERGRKGPAVENRQRKIWTRDDVEKGIMKRRTLGKRRRAQPECNNGIRDRGAILQLSRSLDPF